MFPFTKMECRRKKQIEHYNSNLRLQRSTVNHGPPTSSRDMEGSPWAPGSMFPPRVENYATSTISSEWESKVESEGEKTETVPEGEGDEDEIIQCICMWQHLDCMGLDRNNLLKPGNKSLCERCLPRWFERHNALTLQMHKWEKIAYDSTRDSFSSAFTDDNIRQANRSNLPGRVPKKRSKPLADGRDKSESTNPRKPSDTVISAAKQHQQQQHTVPTDPSLPDTVPKKRAQPLAGGQRKSESTNPWKPSYSVRSAAKQQQKQQHRQRQHAAQTDLSLPDMVPKKRAQPLAGGSRKSESTNPLKPSKNVISATKQQQQQQHRQQQHTAQTDLSLPDTVPKKRAQPLAGGPRKSESTNPPKPSKNVISATKQQQQQQNTAQTANTSKEQHAVQRRASTLSGKNNSLPRKKQSVVRRKSDFKLQVVQAEEEDYQQSQLRVQDRVNYIPDTGTNLDAGQAEQVDWWKCRQIDQTSQYQSEVRKLAEWEESKQYKETEQRIEEWVKIIADSMIYTDGLPLWTLSNSMNDNSVLTRWSACERRRLAQTIFCEENARVARQIRLQAKRRAPHRLRVDRKLCRLLREAAFEESVRYCANKKRNDGRPQRFFYSSQEASSNNPLPVKRKDLLDLFCRDETHRQIREDTLFRHLIDGDSEINVFIPVANHQDTKLFISVLDLENPDSETIKYVSVPFYE